MSDPNIVIDNSKGQIKINTENTFEKKFNIKPWTIGGVGLDGTGVKIYKIIVEEFDCEKSAMIINT